ncbi:MULTISPECIES: FadR/GntR family transcriptional regulator [unclassified Micromonospora]|uniref:FadR/GntR family transcriptional regulator n=1 Tax=unclassified Micromonospora TaxID=2617518 RepID=UPI0036445C36
MTAKYERVAEAIREQIRTGELSVGDKLPSITGLQAQYGVSYGSVRGAMLVLKAEGLVEGRQGEGVYVKAKPAD